jgi:signal transduction histidine kinase
VKLDEMKQAARFGSRARGLYLHWRRYGVDGLLAIGGVAFATAIITVTHLYPRIPTISFVYLLVVLAVASWRGLYAAILASLLAFLAYLYFLVPPLYTFLVPRAEDFFTLVAFLITAITTGQLASALRRRAEQAQSREQELRRLYEQAQELAALQERQRLARELHDSVSQVLYGIGLGAQTAREALESEPEQAAASLEYVIGLAEAGLAEMRALIFELRPESLETEGLVAALTKQVTVLRARYKLNVEADLHDVPGLSLETQHTLYRVAQEALHNIVKHARASTVVLRLTREKREVTLEIGDNGRGFDPTMAFPGHLGLHSMRERIAKAGGTFAVESAPGQGTCIRVHIPLKIGGE